MLESPSSRDVILALEKDVVIKQLTILEGLYQSTPKPDILDELYQSTPEPDPLEEFNQSTPKPGMDPGLFDSTPVLAYAGMLVTKEQNLLVLIKWGR